MVLVKRGVDNSRNRDLARSSYQRGVIARAASLAGHYLEMCKQLDRLRTMVELAVVIGSISAGIFVVHAIEAYHGQ
jgi:hypothetical protein